MTDLSASQSCSGSRPVSPANRSIAWMNGRIPPGSNFVVTALAGEDRPGVPLARSIVGAAVGLLTVSVEEIPAPARAAGKVTLRRRVIHLDGIQNDGIVRRTNAQTHEMQKITADDLASRTPHATTGRGYFQRIRVRVLARLLQLVLRSLLSTLCMFFARRLRIFKVVESMEINQIPPFPRPVGSSLILGEPAVRSRLRVEVSVHEIVAIAAFPEPPVVDWHPGDGSQDLLQSLVRFYNVHPIEI
jgi:hypothetical protein